MHFSLRYLLLLTLATFAARATAADTPWYQVEIVVFENLAPSSTSSELWPDDPGAPDSSARVELIPWALRDSATVSLSNDAADTATPTAGDVAPEQTGGGESDGGETQTVSDAAGLRPFVILPDKFLRLNDVTRKLAQSSQYRVLLHTGWRQPLTKSSKGRAVHVSAGNLSSSSGSMGTDNGPNAPLDGNITVTLSRYLHLQADLLLRKITAATPNSAASDAREKTTNAVAAATEPTTSIVTYRMLQSRRMRSTEIHYLDHPAMGIVAQIIPIKTGGGN